MSEWPPAPPGATVYRFRLPLPPNTMNPRRHSNYHAVAAMKRRYIGSCLLAMKAHLGNLPVFFRADYALRFFFAARHDQDNTAGLAKWPVDSLKFAGIVRDDREAYCRLVALPEQIVLKAVRARKAEGRAGTLKRRWQRDQETGVEIAIWERPSAPLPTAG